MNKGRSSQHIVVVVKIEKWERILGRTASDPAGKNFQEGMVVALVSKKFDGNPNEYFLEIKKNDRIFFDNHAGKRIKIDGEKHTIIREDDIWAVIED